MRAGGKPIGSLGCLTCCGATTVPLTGRLGRAGPNTANISMRYRSAEALGLDIEHPTWRLHDYNDVDEPPGEGGFRHDPDTSFGTSRSEGSGLGLYHHDSAAPKRGHRAGLRPSVAITVAEKSFMYQGDLDRSRLARGSNPDYGHMHTGHWVHIEEDNWQSKPTDLERAAFVTIGSGSRPSLKPAACSLAKVGYAERFAVAATVSTHGEGRSEAPAA